MRLREHTPSLALLARLMQLVQLELEVTQELTQPLPQLPSLLVLRVWTQDLQIVSSVALTLQELYLHAPSIDFRLPYTLARFTRLHTLFVTAPYLQVQPQGAAPLSGLYLHITYKCQLLC